MRNPNQAGQVIIEYVLMIGVSLFILGMIGSAFIRMRNHLWQEMTCDIAAACPGCPPDENVRNRLANACR